MNKQDTDDMTLITNLRQNLENLKVAKEIEESSLIEVREAIDHVEAELHNKDIQITALTDNVNTIISGKITLELEKNVLSDKIARLLEEKAELENNIQILQRNREKIPSKSLITTFRQSLEGMANKLNEPDSKANYTISSMDVKLKTNLSLQDNELQFQLPKPDDIIPPENLSTIEFTIRSSPKDDFLEYLEVPDLTGMTTEEAEYAITNAGFRQGTISEKDSHSPQGMVIDQIPSAGSLTLPEGLIDIKISKIVYIEMPNIVGLDIDSAQDILANSRLEVGEITEKASKSRPGTVLNQSIEAGTKTEVCSLVDIVVAAKEIVEVPGLVGKKLDMAKYLIRSARLKTGNIVKQVSDEKADTVLNQDPHAGSKVVEGEHVDLIISTTEALKVPDVTGKHINTARTILENKELRIGRIIKRTSTLETNIIIEQNPDAGTDAEPGMSVDLVLASQDIEMIEGIGQERGKKLRETGILTIKDLAVADAETVGELVGKSTAEKFISMAKLVDNTSRLGSLGIDRQSAELLVKAGRIDSIDKLKNANINDLYNIMKKAIASGKVKVPADYSLKLDDVIRWAESAQ
jgi:beta-lactam-binding protein with PASTA domain